MVLQETIIPNNVQTYYYVCQPHASSRMVGVIIANNYNVVDDILSFNKDAFIVIKLMFQL